MELANCKMLPCPFCGGEAKVHVCNIVEGNAKWTEYFIDCCECNSSNGLRSKKLKEVKRKWNTRYLPAGVFTMKAVTDER